jgi:cobalt/nickel transport system permease protein
LGGALAAIALGPWAGILVMTAVIAIQGLLFQDGGLVAMGANIVNMGVVTALIGYGLYRSVAGARKNVRWLVAGAAAWLSVETAALLASLQLWISGTSALTVVLPAMLGVHALIGLGEALITVAALGFLTQLRPELMAATAVREKGGRVWVGRGLALSLAVVLLSPWASSHPDGLERVATDLGFMGREQGAPWHILPDYTLPFLSDSALSTIFAGIIGKGVGFAVPFIQFNISKIVYQIAVCGGADAQQREQQNSDEPLPCVAATAQDNIENHKDVFKERVISNNRPVAPTKVFIKLPNHSLSNIKET